MVMLWLRLTLALVFLSFAARADAADPATNAAPATNASASSKPKKKPKTAPLDGDALATTAPPPPYSGPFPRPLASYGDESSTDVFTVLANRAFADKFNLVCTIIFLLEIMHTFLAPRILAWSHSLQDAHDCYNSPEYTAARKFRDQAGQGEFILVEGV